MENTFVPSSPLKTIVPLVALIAAIVLGVIALLRIDTYMKYQAINDCGKVSTYEQILPDNIKVSYPVQDIYNDCLRKKGL